LSNPNRFFSSETVQLIRCSFPIYQSMSAETEYLRDGPEAQRIASVIPFYPFHGMFARLLKE
jgi:hypothetical protein